MAEQPTENKRGDHWQAPPTHVAWIRLALKSGERLLGVLLPQKHGEAVLQAPEAAATVVPDMASEAQTCSSGSSRLGSPGRVMLTYRSSLAGLLERLEITHTLGAWHGEGAQQRAAAPYSDSQAAPGPLLARQATVECPTALSLPSAKR